MERLGRLTAIAITILPIVLLSIGGTLMVQRLTSHQPAATVVPTPLAQQTVAPTATAVGKVSPDTAQSQPRPQPTATIQAQQVSLTSWTDLTGHLHVQVPPTWQNLGPNTDHGESVVRFSWNHDAINCFINMTQQTGSLVDAAKQYQQSPPTNDRQFSFVPTGISAAMLGGQPAVKASFQWTSTKDPSNTGTSDAWLVDWQGSRYLFYCADTSRYGQQISDYLNSITFS
jgi:hypothetical protein